MADTPQNGTRVATYHYVENLNASIDKVIIYGYVAPALAIVTFIANIIICAVLYRIHKNTPTNLFLIAIAVFDALTGIMNTPCSIYIYMLGHYRDYIPYDWCFCTQPLKLAAVFHTSSIYLTVMLAIQRYMGIYNSTLMRRIFSPRKTLIYIFVILSVAMALLAVMFFQEEYKPAEIPSKLNSSVMISACQQWSKTWNTQHYRTVFNSMRVVFIQVIPCILLAIFNVLLIRSINKAKKLRKELSPSYNNTRYRLCRPSSGSTRMTTMLIVIITTTLIAEIITTSNLLVHAADEQNPILDDFTTVSNVIVFISYPTNFVVYCTMSKRFRKGFNSLFLLSGKTSTNYS